jgi:tRNA/tmRNA/rRNA uracil-C5-methylase (TrmA/RlmC/RlmD family)
MQFRPNPYDFTYLDTVQYAAEGKDIVIRGPAPLAGISYSDELHIKQKAFEDFIRKTEVAGKYEPITPSPFTRHYRTTTKRRVVFSTGNIQFRMAEGSGDFPDQDRNEARLEPKQHGEIYAFLRKKLNEPVFVPVGKRCNYIIIRGSYKEFCVIFNMHQLDGSVVRRIKGLAEQLSGLGLNIVSSFIVSNPARSRYYLDKRDSGSRHPVKKLFGPDTLRFAVDELTYLYDATSFSQINQSMVPLMLKKAGQLLTMQDPAHKTMRLIDLFCGYGLFTLYLGRYFGEVFGVDSEGDALNRARDTIAHCREFSRSTKVRFTSGQITAHVLETILPVHGDKGEVIVLDPPRMGVEKGVIGAIAFRNPAKVLHIFCNVDLIPSELQQWERLGYHASHIVPLDMFPGTPHLEVLVLLEARRARG